MEGHRLKVVPHPQHHEGNAWGTLWKPSCTSRLIGRTVEYAIYLSPCEYDFGTFERTGSRNLLVKQGRLRPCLPALPIYTGRRDASLEFEFLEEPKFKTGVRIEQMETGGGIRKIPAVDRIIRKLGTERGVKAIRVELRIFKPRSTQNIHGRKRAEPGLWQQRRKSIIDRSKALTNQFKSFQKTSRRQSDHV